MRRTTGAPGTDSAGQPSRSGTSRSAPGRKVKGRSAGFPELRPPEAEPGGPGLLIATLRVRVPRDLWTGQFSSKHPTIRLEVLNRTDLTADTSVSDYWIAGKPPGVWAPEIGSYPDVLRVDSLAEVADGCLYRVRYQNPPVVYQYRRLGLPLQFPLRIHAGLLTWEVIGRRSDFQEILVFAKRRDPDLQILSVRHRGLRTHLPFLTPTQQQLLADAMSAGYFAVPRGITLTELARRLGRSKSAISEALAIVEKKLLESTLRPTSLLP